LQKSGLDFGILVSQILDVQADGSVEGAFFQHPVESLVDDTFAERPPAEFVVRPRGLFDVNRIDVGLDHGEVERPCFSSLDRRVSNVESHAHFRWIVFTEDFTQIPHRRAEIVFSGVILIDRLDAELTTQLDEVFQLRTEFVELWPDWLVEIVLVVAHPVALHPEIGGGPENSFSPLFVAHLVDARCQDSQVEAVCFQCLDHLRELLFDILGQHVPTRTNGRFDAVETDRCDFFRHIVVAQMLQRFGEGAELVTRRRLFRFGQTGQRADSETGGCQFQKVTSTIGDGWTHFRIVSALAASGKNGDNRSRVIASPFMKIHTTLATLAVLAFSLSDSSAQIIGNSGGGWSIRGTDPIMIFHGGKHVTSYNAGADAGKPYFYPVIGPTNLPMTRKWPMEEGVEGEATDHIHHRGMWYGLGNVNGLDFWHYSGDENKKDKAFGFIRHMGMNGVTMSKKDIVFKTKSEWLAQDDLEKRILSDQREFRLFYTPDGALVVDATISLIADAGDVLIKDDKEGAWSIRTQPLLRLEGDVAEGSIVNSEGLVGKAAWGQRADWVDYFGPDQQGEQVGIAIFDHPSNLRHPTWWHARHYGLFTANPFGEGNFDKEAGEGAGDYTIKNGDTLTFRYRTIFHKGDAESAQIAKAYEAFAKK